MGSKLIDLSGRIFGSLKVLERADDGILPSGKKYTRWLCECKCGRRVPVNAANLRKGSAVSCGCESKKKGSQNLIGRQFDMLKVVKQVDNYISPSGVTMRKWLCVCECGSFVEVLGSSLTSGHTKSCGCLQFSNKIDDSTMVGCVFDKLKVISRAESRRMKSGSVYDMWNCECECGRRTVSFGRNLRIGTTRSCGCTRAKHISARGRQSHAEIWLREYLENHGYKYEQQKTYSDLVGVNDGLLSYDFCVFLSNGEDLLIECQGGQHYEPVDFFGGYTQFEKQVEHDFRKRNYAESHGIILFEINCTRLSKSQFLEKVDKFFCGMNLI